MLEKNKDYVEFTLQCTSVEYGKNKKDKDVCFNGYSDFDFPGVPMDVVCKEFDHKVVMVSKRAFERLQARADSRAELAKQWNENYNLLLKKTGFDTVEALVFYLTNDAQCDTLHEAILKLKDQVKYTCDEWYSANSRNNSWKAAAECNSPKELIEKIEAFEKENVDLKKKNTEYACRIQDLIDDKCGRKTVIESYKRSIEKWREATGCLRPEDISTESLTYKCKSLDQEVKILDKEIAQWKAITKCETPEAAETWLRAYHSSCEVIKKWRNETDCPSPSAAGALLRHYSGEIDKWKKATKCDSYEAAATWITSYESACERGNNLARKLEEWKGAIEGLENAVRLTNKNMQKELEREIDAWQKATGCKTPEEAETILRNLRSRIDEIKEFAAIASNWTDRIVED